MCPDYRRLEKKCEWHGVNHLRDPDWMLGLTPISEYKRVQAELKLLDLRMLATEKRDLMPMSDSHVWAYTQGAEPFADEITPWSAEYAAKMWLERYQQIKPESAPDGTE